MGSISKTHTNQWFIHQYHLMTGDKLNGHDKKELVEVAAVMRLVYEGKRLQAITKLRKDGWVWDGESMSRAYEDIRHFWGLPATPAEILISEVKRG